MDVHRAALEKLSPADRDLIRENQTQDSQAYNQMCVRWDIALATAAREMNYRNYIHRTDLGWL
jgi:hypothetical protein